MDITFLYLFLAGVACGLINVVSAGGSFITLPLLIFMGLPATVANATNRVAIFMQNMVSVPTFYLKKELDLKGASLLAIPAVLGGVVGSFVAVSLDDKMMKRVIAIVLLVMLFSLFFQAERWLKGVVKVRKGPLTVKEFVSFFFVGIYGGFIQAGVGVFLLAASVWATGYSLKQANPIKVFIALSYTIVALVIFSANDLIRWEYGVILGLGNMLGAWLGVHLSIKGGANLIRWMLVVVILFFSLYFLDLW